MANSYPRGEEPACPIQGPKCTGVIRTKGCASCHACGRMVAAPKMGEIGRNGVKSDGDTAEIAQLTSEPVRTLDDLIRVCQIDTAVWEVERWVANKWEQAHTDAKKQAHVTPSTARP